MNKPIKKRLLLAASNKDLFPDIKLSLTSCSPAELASVSLDLTKIIIETF